MVSPGVGNVFRRGVDIVIESHPDCNWKRRNGMFHLTPLFAVIRKVIITSLFFLFLFLILLSFARLQITWWSCGYPAINWKVEFFKRNDNIFLSDRFSDKIKLKLLSKSILSSHLRCVWSHFRSVQSITIIKCLFSHLWFLKVNLKLNFLLHSVKLLKY